MYHTTDLLKHLCQHSSETARVNKFVLGSTLSSLPRRQRSMVWLVLNIATVWNKTTIRSHRLVLVTLPLGESPFATDVYLLTSGELELGSSQSLDDLVLVHILHTHRQDDLTNVHSGDSAKRLAISATHSRLQPIGASA